MRSTSTRATEIDLDAPAGSPARRGRVPALVVLALVGGLALGLAGSRLLTRPEAAPAPAAAAPGVAVAVDDGPAPPPPTADPLPLEQATTPEAAVRGFLTAEARGDFAASYAYLSAADRTAYPTDAAWVAAHADLPPITGFAVEQVREDGAVVTLLALRSTLDQVVGLVPARSRAAWPTVAEDGGRRVAFSAATATPLYPGDGPVAEVVRRWATARQDCATEGQYAGPLIGSPALAEQLCGADGELVLGAPGVLTDAADTTALLNAYGPEVYTWARTVDLDAPVPMRVVTAPLDDEWRVVGVLPRG